MRRPSTPWFGARYAERSPRSIWRAAAPRITAGLGAHSVVVALTALTSSVPLLTALVATLVFAGITLAHHTRGRASIAGASRPLMVPMLAGALALVSIGAGAWVIGRVVGTGAAFYCEPLVPWRIEIALFGSFVGGYLTVMAHARHLAWAVYPLMLLALLWIAPFYGFFSAPVFLGVSLNTLCPDRPLPTVLLTALSMLVGEGVGSAVADWMSGRSTAPSSGDH